MKKGCLFQLFCLLMSFALVLSARAVTVFFAPPPSRVTIAGQAGEAFKPKKRKG